MKRNAYVMVLFLAALLAIPLGIYASSIAPQAASPDFGVSPEDRLSEDLPLAMRDDGTATVMVELARDPLGVVYAEMQGSNARADIARATQAQLALVEADQAEAMASILAIDPTAVELYRVQRALNGIALKVDSATLRDIAALNGVLEIWPLIPQEINHSTSVPLLGAPEIWDSMSYDMTGEGISIGIIDTGIDYHHSMFGGPGGAYELNDTTTLADGLDAFFGPTAVKVVGGFDFVGDAYDAGDEDNDTPNPDPDPWDCNGHGTHVAGTAAGFGVNADGTTYVGGYDNVPFSSLKIGPGMAPEADLYALRVFGCEGSTLVTEEAIDWSIDPNGDGILDDHLDVINMSLGSSYGRTPSAKASEIASTVGVIVVASAGNSGDTYYVTGSPGVAGQTLSVAGSVDASTITDGFRVNGGPLDGVHPALSGVAFDFSTFTALTGTLTYPADQASGCAEFSEANKALITGTIVLLNWTDNECGSSTRGNNLEDAGAIGMLLADNSAVFDLSIFGSDEMPSYSIPLEIGEALADTLDSEGSIEVTLTSEYDNSFTYLTPQFVDTVYTSSSRGPRSDDSYLKPDITAVAVSVFSAATGTGTEGASFNGTSMAAPHVAGMMALLREQHPSWTVEELKALAMNTATYDIFTGPDRTGDKYGPGRIGAGRISVPNAAANEVVAYNDEETGLVSVSFGVVDVVSGTVAMAEKDVLIENKGSSSVDYVVLYEPRVETEGVSYTLSDPTVSLAPGDSTVVTVMMEADGMVMSRGSADPTVDLAPGGFPRHFVSEAAGYVMFVPESGFFTAELSGDQEVPANSSPVTATIEMEYGLLDVIEYEIEFFGTITVTAAHIHLAPEGANGPVVVNLNLDADTYNAGDTFEGESDPLTDVDDIQQLFTRGTYVNVHTDAFVDGEIRGQVIAENTHLRVPVHSVPRVVSDMAVVETEFTGGMTGTLNLEGDDIDNPDLTSLVTAFELQIMSENDELVEDRIDIEYVGVTSDIADSVTITDTTVYFGVSMYGDATASWRYGYFQVHIDIDEDGVDDYILFPTDFAADDFIVVVVDLSTGSQSIASNINLVNGAVDTNIYNTNLKFFPVDAADIGLGVDNTDFNYYVVSFTPFDPGEVTQTAYYDAANPGVTFTNNLVGPVFADLDGGTIEFEYDTAAVLEHQSKGILLLHHHNGVGERVEVVEFTGISNSYLPLAASE